MEQKYKNWIIKNNYNDPQLATGKCIEAVNKMINDFPELSKAGGIVFSYTNLDNFKDYVKEYTHMWCKDQRDNIIDPTKSQFILLGELIYKELDLNVNHVKCLGCGKYYPAKTNGYCGKCKWSN